CMQGIQFLLTF
nr:immunoglobulin light chain junction region [Macaca mulatta]MPN90635.1 immunoglobulin light chain junction region [Macaca mulatta]